MSAADVSAMSTRVHGHQAEHKAEVARAEAAAAHAVAADARAILSAADWREALSLGGGGAAAVRGRQVGMAVVGRSRMACSVGAAAIAGGWGGRRLAEAMSGEAAGWRLLALDALYEDLSEAERRKLRSPRLPNADPALRLRPDLPPLPLTAEDLRALRRPLPPRDTPFLITQH